MKSGAADLAMMICMTMLEDILNIYGIITRNPRLDFPLTLFKGHEASRSKGS
jgi:hypothetical protein